MNTPKRAPRAARPLPPPHSTIVLAQDIDDLAAGPCPERQRRVRRVSERQPVTAMAAVYFLDGFVDRARALGHYAPPPASAFTSQEEPRE